MNDVPLDAHEHAEHAEHAAHDPFIARVSMTIAVLAVVAAVSGTLETLEDGAAILSQNEAVLAQNEATDSWGFYEAKSLKKHMFAIAADAGGPKADEYRAESKQNSDEGKAIQEEAKKHQAERDDHLKETGVHEKRHHRLAIGATLAEMAIAIATIAIITRNKLPWLASVALGAGGAIAVALAYLT